MGRKGYCSTSGAWSLRITWSLGCCLWNRTIMLWGSPHGRGHRWPTAPARASVTWEHQLGCVSEGTFKWSQHLLFESLSWVDRYWRTEVSHSCCALHRLLTHKIYEHHKWIFYATTFWSNLLCSQSNWNITIQSYAWSSLHEFPVPLL